MFPAAKFPDGIPLEMTIEVFRTHKGNQEKGVAGTITLGNPATGKKGLYGEFLLNAQGNDLFAAVRTPQSLDELKHIMPSTHKQLTMLVPDGPRLLRARASS